MQGWEIIVNSQTEAKLIENCRTFAYEFQAHLAAVAYALDCIRGKDQEAIVHAWINQHTHFNLFTTSHVESLHHHLKERFQLGMGLIAQQTTPLSVGQASV